ncbi:hypothetical protein COU79_01375 [Candidatus Peregrinibacteria bacterium CG10_big_fil_rev_8_21_14_0_10_54_7]|nr:MAG: hypothetical protein COU79_01375 [Candidatus Peregrinibacteria bacterium CG10_big_fil_rev_8_21_14_0_10_54_7]
MNFRNLPRNPVSGQEFFLFQGLGRGRVRASGAGAPPVACLLDDNGGTGFGGADHRHGQASGRVGTAWIKAGHPRMKPRSFCGTEWPS